MTEKSDIIEAAQKHPRASEHSIQVATARFDHCKNEQERKKLLNEINASAKKAGGEKQGKPAQDKSAKGGDDKAKSGAGYQSK